jgi:hypothetical protein
MFIGHYAPAFVIAALNPRGPNLGVLFVAVQAVDYGFFTLSLMGIERASHDPSLSGIMPIDLEYMPFTHSLIPATLIWALTGAVLAMVLAPQGRKALFGWSVGLAVASHWFVDLLVHRPDLGLLWDTSKVGLGLWNHPMLAMPLEIGVLAIGLFMFVASRRFETMKAIGALSVLIVTLLLAQAINWFTPAPTGLLATAVPPLLIYTIFAAIAFWVDKTAPFANPVIEPSSSRG